MDQHLTDLIDTLTDPLNELAALTDAALEDAHQTLKAAADELRTRGTEHPGSFTDADTADARKMVAAYEALVAERQRRAEAKPKVRRPSLAELAATKPDQPQPETRPTPDVKIVSERGHQLTTLAELAEEFADRWRVVQAVPARGVERHRFAQLRAPEAATDRTLHGDTVADGQKIGAVVASARRNPAEFDALVASGGFCVPAQPYYEEQTISTRDRPVRDSMPAFRADRGSLSFVPPLQLASVITGGPAQAGAAISTWTNAIDTTPGESTKTYQTIACRSNVTVQVQAIVARTRWGNFGMRSHPEGFAQVIDVVMAQHSRVAETALLDGMLASSIEQVQTGVVGSARDVLHHVRQAAAGMRFRHRMPPSVRLHAIMPSFVLDLMAADVVMQQASGSVDALAWSEQQIRGALAAMNVNVTFALDVATGADWFQTPTDGANLADWPDNIWIYLYPEGSFIFLDAGVLDLGVVRDSTLNNTNDCETFVETFEAVAFVGHESIVLELTTCPNGDSQVATDLTGSLCSGS